MEYYWMKCPKCKGKLVTGGYADYYFKCNKCTKEEKQGVSFPEGYLKGFWDGYEKGKDERG